MASAISFFKKSGFRELIAELLGRNQFFLYCFVQRPRGFLEPSPVNWREK